MIDIQEINEAIAKLENSDTTYSNCEKLSVLYTVKENLDAGVERVKRSSYSYAEPPESEFYAVASKVPIGELLSVLDEHMTAVQALYPKEYSIVLEKIKSI